MNREREEKFGIDRGGAVKNRFKLIPLRNIPVGGEGRKIIADITSKRGAHGRYFLKETLDAKRAHRQREKWLHLKKHHVSVPDVFKPVQLRNGASAVIVSDLTVNGTYWVFGMNNPEVDEDCYKEVILRIPPATRRKIIRDMVHACEAAATPHTPGGSIYEFQGNAFILALNPAEPRDAKIYVADLGVDVIKRGNNKRDDVLRRNLQSAATFYAWMMGENFQFPSTSTYAHLNSALRKEVILKYRKWSKKKMKKVLEE